MLSTLTAPQLKHLMVRSCFNAAPAQLTAYAGQPAARVVHNILAQCSSPASLNVVSPEWYSYTTMQLAAVTHAKKEDRDTAQALRKTIAKETDNKSRDLNTDWYRQIISTQQPFLEKLTLFWHGHFACRNRNPYVAQQLNNTIRQNALGNFKTLLLAVSKSPAMLQYLNNQQNVKAHPNENFAREVMELFTIGRGNYTENDVKQAARAFTGFAYKGAEYRFNAKQHDDGPKTFMGKTGNFTGEDVIDIILQRPETARFIARKAYLFFVADTANDTHINQLATAFYKSNYSLRTLFTQLFTAPWFYSAQVMGTKIKSPAELLAGMCRTFNISINNPNILVQLQRGLGQYLFNPPNVAGWPYGQAWIDSSTLALRMHVPAVLLGNAGLKFKPRADIEQEVLLAANQTPAGQPAVTPAGNTTVNWQPLLSALQPDADPRAMAAYLLQCPLTPDVLALLPAGAPLALLAQKITALPQYQLT